MEYPSLLLLLVLTASVFSVRSQCPPVEDIYPCQCSLSMIVVCENKGMTLNELKSALSHFSKEVEIYTIELKYLNLGTIPSNFFEGITAYRMVISNCEVDFENGKPPLKGLEDSLQDLSITSSLKQKNVPLYLKFGHLKELKMLTLMDNKITELRDDMFDDEMSNLYLFDLSNNVIEKIGERAFENLTNVKYCTLSGNRLGSLQRNMIPTSTQLSRLWLDDNGLMELQDDLFSSVPSLIILTLEKNEIKTFERNTWENIIEQLTFISLEENPIQCDSGMDWLIKSSVSAYKIHGRCAGPTTEKGLDISRFIINSRLSNTV